MNEAPNSLQNPYFGNLILVRSEALSYRRSPISPSRWSDPGILAEQVTVSWAPVARDDEPAALAAWFVNLARPEIGAEAAGMLQNLIAAQWESEGGFRSLFEQVVAHRRALVAAPEEEAKA